MHLLIDTHVLIWARTDPSRLSEAVREAMTDPAHRKIISVVSLTEVAIKASIGKIRVDPTFFDTVDTLGADIQQFSARHAKTLATVPVLHRDPFDRMLIAQAQLESLVIVTADGSFGDYDVDRLDART